MSIDTFEQGRFISIVVLDALVKGTIGKNSDDHGSNCFRHAHGDAVEVKVSRFQCHLERGTEHDGEDGNDKDYAFVYVVCYLLRAFALVVVLLHVQLVRGSG